jgi:hypothetical protein
MHQKQPVGSQKCLISHPPCSIQPSDGAVSVSIIYNSCFDVSEAMSVNVVPHSITRCDTSTV